MKTKKKWYLHIDGVESFISQDDPFRNANEKFDTFREAKEHLIYYLRTNARMYRSAMYEARKLKKEEC